MSTQRTTFDVSMLSYFFIIKVYDKSRNIIHSIKWDELRFDLLSKYKWYFEYRSALIKIKYPKYDVENVWGSYEAKGDQLIISLKNRIRAKKSKITEYVNKLEKAKQQWDSLFRIEDDVLYQKAIIKIERLKNELGLLEQQLAQKSIDTLQNDSKRCE